MKPLAALLLLGSTLALSACGPDAFTRGVTGAGAGALAAGPVGAAVGSVAGATGAVQVR